MHAVGKKFCDGYQDHERLSVAPLFLAIRACCPGIVDSNDDSMAGFGLYPTGDSTSWT